MNKYNVEWKEIKDIFNIKNGYTPSTKRHEYWKNGTIPWFRLDDIRENGNILCNSKKYITTIATKNNPFEENSIILSTTATIGVHALIQQKFLCNQQFTCFSLNSLYKNKLNIKFVYYYFYIIDNWCINNCVASSFKSVKMNELKKLLFPIPQLEVQNKIVEILDNFSKYEAELEAELEARLKQYKYYLNKLLDFSNDNYVEWKTIKDICEIKRGERITKKQLTNKGKYKVISGGKEIFGRYNKYNRDENTISICQYGTAGFIDFQKEKYWANDVSYSIFPINIQYLSNKFLYYSLINKQKEIYGLTTKAIPDCLPKEKLQEIKIPIPPLEVQNKIVEILDNFSSLVNDIKDGLPKEIELRKKQYKYYLNKLLSFGDDNE